MIKKAQETKETKSKSKVQEALELALGAIEKAHGKGSVMRGDESLPDTEFITTGCFGTDLMLGGGWAKGRVVEIYGPESSGKTTLSLHAIAAAQKRGEICAFMDLEHALDPVYAEALGVNMNDLLISQPSSGEQAFQIAETLINSGAISIIVIDSVAALLPQREIDKEIGQASPGAQASLMSQAMRKIPAACQRSGTTLIFINQIRMKIGVMFGCFHYDTLVNFVDGRSIPIGQVVDEKITGDVYCFNSDTKAIQERSIIDWHDNGKIEKPQDFIHVQTTSIDGKSRFGFTCTPEHKILTNSGWKQAQNLSFEDKLISKYKKTVTGSYEMFMKGVTITEIRPASMRQMKNKRKFDISVEGNHNYMVGGINNGVIVHNSPETTSGGQALKFYASQRVDVRRIATTKEGTEAVSNRTRAKCVKNKVARPFRITEFDLVYGQGIDTVGDILDIAVEIGLINKSGAWYSYKDDRIGQGRSKSVAYLKESKEMFAEVDKKVRMHFGMHSPDGATQ